MEKEEEARVPMEKEEEAIAPGNEEKEEAKEPTTEGMDLDLNLEEFLMSIGSSSHSDDIDNDSLESGIIDISAEIEI